MQQTQPWSVNPQRNRENNQRRGRGRGRAPFPNTTRPNRNLSSIENTAHPASSLTAPPSTITGTQASGSILSQQSPRVLISTTTTAAAAAAPPGTSQTNDHFSNKPPSQTQVSNPHIPQTLLNQDESPSTQRHDNDTATPIFPDGATVIHLSDLLEYPDAPMPDRAPTPEQYPFRGSDCDEGEGKGGEGEK